MAKKKIPVSVNEQKLYLSNLDKVLFPESKILKAEVIQYYLKIAPYFLKFAQDRILSVIRYPDGIDKTKFYAKNAPDWKPDWVETYLLEDGISYVLMKNEATLVWFANLAALELHASSKRLMQEYAMDHIIFDFDPDEHMDYVVLRDMIVQIGEYIRTFGLKPYVKTSGSKGAHIYIPIQRTTDFDAVIEKIKQLALVICKKFPEHTTLFFRKEKRKGKVLIDINRNYRSQTCVLPLSTRAREKAPVSMPLFWADFAQTKSSQAYTIHNAMTYIQDKGYAWEDMTDAAVSILDCDFNTTSKKKASVQDEKPIKNKAIDITELVQAGVLVDDGWYERADYKHMLCGVEKELILDDAYIYENKWDGIRVFIYLANGACKILTKSGRDISSKYPEIVRIGESSKEFEGVLDAELVVLDSKGRPDFSRIISRLHSTRSVDKQQKLHPVFCYVFDILLYRNRELVKLPWYVRRSILKESLKDLEGFRLSTSFNEGSLLYEAAKQMGLEGIMKKRKDGIYTIGQRSDHWLKIKFRNDLDCIILGYTEGTGDRKPYFGSLHIGELDADNNLIYRGRVGSGFDQDKLEVLSNYLKSLVSGPKWFPDAVEDANKTVWLRHVFPYCEIQYATMTASGTLREPVFKKLKEDEYRMD